LNAGYQILLTGAEFAETVSLVSAVLPSSRSVQFGDPATAFATIINTGQSIARNCGIAPLSTISADFSFQTTDASNHLIGTQDAPVDIPAGGSQSYLFAFTPTAPFAPVDVQLTFDCTNSDPAPVTVGLNTLQLVADSGPVADVIALVATVQGNGIVDAPISGVGFFSVATVNVGVAAAISASADTGSAALPVSLTICQTDPSTAACINPATPTAMPVTLSIGANETPTFSVFVAAAGAVPFDPANSRVFVRFEDNAGISRGATSVAVRNAP